MSSDELKSIVKKFNEQGKGGWPGHVIRDMKAACKGANIACEMQIQFDSEGGSNLVTPIKQIEQWIQNVKTVILT